MTEDPNWEKLNRLFANTSVDQFFQGEVAGVPFPRASQNKYDPLYDRDAVHSALRRNPPELSDVDPRTLRSTQRSVTKGGVDYYANNSRYSETGDTYADSNQSGNRFPVVYRKPGESLILSGHHRATAALFKGEPLRAIVVDHPSNEA